ncbi:hypothetical protein MHU86_2987 [Fragilaria crotonensis]|nr:hypothetical protein MHU86_2987 [Fragilaria crotonensis]
MRRMRSPSIPAHKRAMALPARVERAETSEAAKPGSGEDRTNRCQSEVMWDGRRLAHAPYDSERIEVGSRSRLALAEVLDTSNQAKDKTKGRVARPGVANGLPAHSVLLGCERESGERSE